MTYYAATVKTTDGTTLDVIAEAPNKTSARAALLDAARALGVEPKSIVGSDKGITETDAPKKKRSKRDRAECDKCGKLVDRDSLSWSDEHGGTVCPRCEAGEEARKWSSHTGHDHEATRADRSRCRAHMAEHGTPYVRPAK